MTQTPRSRSRRIVRVLAAVGAVLALSGCIVAPYPYRPFRPHPYYYY